MACEEQDQQTPTYLPSDLLPLGVMQQSDRELPAFVGPAEAGWPGRPLAVRPCSRGARHLFGQERKTTLKRGDEHEPKSAGSLFSDIRTDFVFSKTPPLFFCFFNNNQG